MVCINRGVYGFLGLSWVLITMVCPPRNSTCMRTLKGSPEGKKMSKQVDYSYNASKQSHQFVLPGYTTVCLGDGPLNAGPDSIYSSYCTYSRSMHARSYRSYMFALCPEILSTFDIDIKVQMILIFRAIICCTATLVAGGRDSSYV